MTDDPPPVPTDDDPTPTDPAGLAEAFSLVPYVGKGRRWYDWPYRVLNFTFLRPGPRKFWHTSVVELAAAATARLQAINSLERARLRSPRAWDTYEMTTDESLVVPSYWIAEFFTPSNVSKLFKRIESRGWGDRSATESMRFVEVARQRQSTGSWSRLVTFQSSASQRLGSQAVKRKLPDGIEAIDLHLIPVGPALTCVVAEFTLDKAGEGTLDTELRKERRSSITRHGTSVVTVNARTVAAEAIREARARFHAVGKDWLAREVPGVFAAENTSNYPILDLLVFDKYDPFTMDENLRDEYLAALGVGQSDWTILTLPSTPKIRLDPYSYRGKVPEPFSYALTTRLADAFGKADDFDGYHLGRTARNIAQRLELDPAFLISRLALFALVALKEEQSAVTRDIAYAAHGRFPVKSAERIRSSILRGSLDLSSIGTDLNALENDPALYAANIPDIHEVAGRWDKKAKADKDVLSRWSRQQAETARRLVELDATITNNLQIVSSLNAAIEGIRSQRVGIGVAVLSLAAGLAAVWISAVALSISLSQLP